MVAKVNKNAKNIPVPKKSIDNRIIVDSFIFPDTRGLLGLSILSIFISKRIICNQSSNIKKN